MSKRVSVEAPEGTCVSMPGRPGFWLVRGRKSWYECDAARGECECGDFVHRKAVTRTPCRHLRALNTYLSICGAVTAPPKEPLPSDAELRRIFA